MHSGYYLSLLLTSLPKYVRLLDDCAARDALGSPFSELFEHVLTRAVSRGLLAKSIDIDIISEVFPAITFHYVAALGLPINEHLIFRVIDGIMLPALGAM